MTCQTARLSYTYTMLAAKAMGTLKDRLPRQLVTGIAPK